MGYASCTYCTISTIVYEIPNTYSNSFSNLRRQLPKPIKRPTHTPLRHRPDLLSLIVPSSACTDVYRKQMLCQEVSIYSPQASSIPLIMLRLSAGQHGKVLTKTRMCLPRVRPPQQLRHSLLPLLRLHLHGLFNRLVKRDRIRHRRLLTHRLPHIPQIMHRHA